MAIATSTFTVFVLLFVLLFTLWSTMKSRVAWLKFEWRASAFVVPSSNLFVGLKLEYATRHSLWFDIACTLMDTLEIQCDSSTEIRN
jgi:hypothetical protein